MHVTHNEYAHTVNTDVSGHMELSKTHAQGIPSICTTPYPV